MFEYEDSRLAVVWRRIARKFTVRRLVIFYLFMGVLTYGHSASTWDCSHHDDPFKCNVEIAAHSVASAPFWPYYWSWIAWDAIR